MIVTQVPTVLAASIFFSFLKGVFYKSISSEVLPPVDRTSCSQEWAAPPEVRLRGAGGHLVTGQVPALPARRGQRCYPGLLLQSSNREPLPGGALSRGTVSMSSVGPIRAATLRDTQQKFATCCVISFSACLCYLETSIVCHKR